MSDTQSNSFLALTVEITSVGLNVVVLSITVLCSAFTAYFVLIFTHDPVELKSRHVCWFTRSHVPLAPSLVNRTSLKCFHFRFCSIHVSTKLQTLHFCLRS